MDIRRTTLIGATLMLTALLAACANAKQDQSPTPSAVLVDTEWVLISLHGDALIEDTEITLNFEEASLDGSAGCNTYGGSYTASQDSLRLSGLEWTEMGCPEPEGILDQETAYLNALNATCAGYLAHPLAFVRLCKVTSLLILAFPGMDPLAASS